MRRILFVAELFWPHIGGAETLLENVCRGLVVSGYEVTVVPTKLKGYKKYEIWHGIKIYRVNCFNRYGFTFFSLWKIYKLAKYADVIHTITFNASLPAWIVARISNKPCYLTVLEVWGDFWKEIPGINIFHGLFEKFIMALDYDKYIAISQFTKKQMRTIYDIREDKIEVIYPGVDYDLFDYQKYNKAESRDYLKLNQGDFLYLYFGRPGWAKGLEYLLEAVPLISQRIPGAKLLLILSETPGRQYRKVLDLVKKLGIEKNIILLKSMPKEKLIRYLVASDCVVIPSLSEGFGFSAAEASALKIPLVITKVGSLPEVASGTVIWLKSRSANSIVDGVCHVPRGRWVIIPPKKFFWDDYVQKIAILS